MKFGLWRIYRLYLKYVFNVSFEVADGTVVLGRGNVALQLIWNHTSNEMERELDNGLF